jgi:type VII secretion-associated serine protease mycosin
VRFRAVGGTAAACLLIGASATVLGVAGQAAAHPRPHPSPHASPSHRPTRRQSRPPTPAVPANCPRLQRVHLTRAALWPQQQLDFRQVWPVTTGSGVTVAVIDSGLNATNRQLRRAHVLPGIDATSRRPSQDVFDCVGHGSEVAAVIAAQPGRRSPFLGVAPGVRILPIRQTTQAQQQSHGSSILARAIEDAIHAGAQVANVSLTASAGSPALLAAVRDADRAGLIIVAAAGNKGESGNEPQYPAAYSTRFPNVIAVAASDRNDDVPGFPNSGNYVDIAAPGKDLAVPAPGHGFAMESGTSFAAPYVTGTVALLLAAHPKLSPAQVRARIEDTADQPGVTVPNARFGYGVVDPYRAVTSVQSAATRSSTPPRRVAFPPPVAPTPPSRHLQHVALAAGVALVGVACCVLVIAMVIRSSRQVRRARHPVLKTIGRPDP